MIQTVFNWLKFDVQNFIVEVWWCCLVLWCLLLIIAISDVVTHGLNRTSKATWILAILFLPLAGLFAYCIFCLSRADYYMLEFLTRRRKNPRSARLKALKSTPILK